MDNEKERDLLRRIEIIEIKIDKHEKSIDQIWESLKNIWVFIRTYFRDRMHKIGRIQVSKKTALGVFISIIIFMLNNLLRILDVY